MSELAQHITIQQGEVGGELADKCKSYGVASCCGTATPQSFSLDPTMTSLRSHQTPKVGTAASAQPFFMEVGGESHLFERDTRQVRGGRVFGIGTLKGLDFNNYKCARGLAGR